MADNTVQLEARRWIDSLEGKWRLEVLSKRQRFNWRTGERKDMPTRVRRFAEGIPWAYVTEGIRYLISKAPYRGIVFNGVELDEAYRPTLTSWRRDMQDVVNGPRQAGDATYTLVQDLIASDERDLYASVSSVSCSEEVVSEWHWDEPDIEPLPPPEQGVTWQIAAVNRKEDGTFDYALIKRTAITQHAGVATTKDTTTETVRYDSWDNVYTDVDGNYVDNTGAPLDIPEAYAKDGVVCEVARTENPDCTFKINVTWTESKDVTVKESCGKTQYQHDHSVSKVGQDAPLGEAPEASGGVIEQHEDQLQPDGKFSTVKSTKTELPVEAARVKVTIGRRGYRTERTDRNQPEAAATEGLGVGQGVEVVKTDGGLFDNTYTNFDHVTQQVGESCEIDQFKHDHSETISGVDAVPGLEEHVEGSGRNGDVKTRRTEMDDEGSIVQTNMVHHEREVLKHRETWQVGLRGVRHSVTDTQTSPDNVPEPPSYAKENIGKSVSVEKTPGGLVNITVEDTARETPLDAGEGCGKTVFEHRDTTITNDPDGGFDGHVPDAGGGKYYENQSRLNEDGTSTVERTEHVELNPGTWTSDKRKTLRGVLTTETTRNTNDDDTVVDKVGDRITLEKTPGGLYNRSETHVDREFEPFTVAKSCARTMFEERDSKTVAQPDEPQDDHTGEDAGDGHTYSMSATQNDEGTWSVSTGDNAERERKTARHSKSKSLRGVTESRMDRNVDNDDVEVENVGDAVQVEMTDGGLYNRTETHVDRNFEPFTVAKSCARTMFEERDSKTVAQPDEPQDDHTGEDAGDGHTYSMSAAQNDEGTWSVSTGDNAERERKTARHSKSKSLRGVTESRMDRNVDNDDVEVENVGDAVQVEMTDGGLYNRTETHVDRNFEPFTVAKSCARTMFEERDSKTVAQPDEPQDDHTGEDAGDGHTYSMSAAQNDEGTWSVSTGDNAERERKTARHSKSKSLRGVTESWTDRNVDNSDVEVEKVGDAVQVEMTDGGLYNRTETHVDRNFEPFTVAKSCARTMFEERDSKTVAQPDEPQDDHTGEDAGGGHTYSMSATQNDEGSWSVSTGDNTERPREKSRTQDSEDYFETTNEHLDRNQEDRDDDYEYDDQTHKLRTVQNTLTDGGRFDVRKVEQTATGRELELEYESSGRRQFLYRWWNQKKEYADTLLASKGKNKDRYSVTMTSAYNKFGLVDGEARVSDVLHNSEIDSDIVNTGWVVDQLMEYEEVRERPQNDDNEPVKSAICKYLQWHRLGYFNKLDTAIDKVNETYDEFKGCEYAGKNYMFGVTRRSVEVFVTKLRRKLYRVEMMSNALPVKGEKWKFVNESTAG